MTYDAANPALDPMNDAAEVLDRLAHACHSNAVAHGFYDADFELRGMAARTSERVSSNHEQNECLKRHALIVSEVGELTEAVRKPSAAYHISEPTFNVAGNHDFTQEEEELADIFIRCFDYAAFRKLRLGAAVLAKMKFNEGREHMHGKRS